MGLNSPGNIHRRFRLQVVHVTCAEGRAQLDMMARLDRVGLRLSRSRLVPQHAGQRETRAETARYRRKGDG